jgi:hypothetical protein
MDVLFAACWRTDVFSTGLILFSLDLSPGEVKHQAEVDLHAPIDVP